MPILQFSSISASIGSIWNILKSSCWFPQCM
jgi:hypothetical protein